MAPRIPTPVVRRHVLNILAALGCRARRQMPELSVVLTGDSQVQALNRAWRHQDKPTDVLSFSQIEQADAASHLPSLAPNQPPEMQAVWGDVVISYDTASQQAQRYGHCLSDEVRVLLVHGILHLLGHDHEHGDAQAARMRREEVRILAAVRRMDARRRRS